MNEKGFIIFDSLFSLSLTFLIVFSLIPLMSIIHAERQVLTDRIIISSFLHDELQQTLQDDPASSRLEYIERLQNKEISLSFIKEDSYIKGCAKWTNKRSREDGICFYGIFEK